MDLNQKSINELDVSKAKNTTKRLRVFGPILLLIAISGLVTGIILTTRYDHKFMPIIFVSMFLLFFGLLLTITGFIGAMQKYTAVVAAPIAKDAANYMIDGTDESISDLAGKVSDKTAKNKKNQVVCPNCHLLNDASRKYCGECGEALPNNGGK